MWAGRGLKFQSTTYDLGLVTELPPISVGKRQCFSRLPLHSSGISHEMTFTNAQGVCKIPLPAIQLQKENCVEIVANEFMVSSNSGGENDCTISASSINLATWMWQKGTLWLSCNPVHGHRPCHLQGFLSAATWGCGNFCPPDILWRLGQGEGRRLSDKSGSSLQSSRQDAPGWGREENTMWMGGVKGIWGLLHRPAAFS